MQISEYMDETINFPCITKQKRLIFHRTHMNISAAQQFLVHTTNRKYSSWLLRSLSIYVYNINKCGMQILLWAHHFGSKLWYNYRYIQYIPRNMHTVFALLCFVVVIHWLIFPYPSGLLHWHCGNLAIAPVPAKQPWWIWINTSCEFIMNDCITTTKQSTTKPCAYFLGYTV